MLFGATTLFAQLQTALNDVWHVKQQPANAALEFLRNRLMSFALILVIGFLLTVSLIVSAVLAALETYFGTPEIAFVFMVWVYYAALVLFFGAEITQAVSKNRGEAIRPKRHAKKED